jgi:alpha-ribazole phosphatase
MAGGTVRKVTRWWWIRHAPAIDHEGRLYGQRDVDCDCSDRAAFAALAGALPKEAVWVTTPLKRTRETAAAIQAAAGTEIEPMIEPMLIEQNFGAWQGQKRAEIIRHHLWIAGADETPPGGENFNAVMARVKAAIERLTHDYSGRDIVAVAHGGVIRSALGHALELPGETALAFAIDNLSLTIIEYFTERPEGHGTRIVGVNRPPR